MKRKDLYKLIDRRNSGEFEDPIGFEEYLQSLVDCLGDDERQIEEFIKTEESEYVYALSEAYEEIIEKFPDGNMEKLFNEWVM